MQEEYLRDTCDVKFCSHRTKCEEINDFFPLRSSIDFPGWYISEISWNGTSKPVIKVAGIKQDEQSDGRLILIAVWPHRYGAGNYGRVKFISWAEDVANLGT